MQMALPESLANHPDNSLPTNEKSGALTYVPTMTANSGSSNNSSGISSINNSRDTNKRNSDNSTSNTNINTNISSSTNSSSSKMPSSTLSWPSSSSSSSSVEVMANGHNTPTTNGSDTDGAENKEEDYRCVAATRRKRRDSGDATGKGCSTNSSKMTENTHGNGLENHGNVSETHGTTASWENLTASRDKNTGIQSGAPGQGSGVENGGNRVTVDRPFNNKSSDMAAAPVSTAKQETERVVVSNKAGLRTEGVSIIDESLEGCVDGVGGGSLASGTGEDQSKRVDHPAVGGGDGGSATPTTINVAKEIREVEVGGRGLVGGGGLSGRTKQHSLRRSSMSLLSLAAACQEQSAKGARSLGPSNVGASRFAGGEVTEAVKLPAIVDSDPLMANTSENPESSCGGTKEKAHFDNDAAATDSAIQNTIEDRAVHAPQGADSMYTWQQGVCPSLSPPPTDSVAGLASTSADFVPGGVSMGGDGNGPLPGGSGSLGEFKKPSAGESM